MTTLIAQATSTANQSAVRGTNLGFEAMNLIALVLIGLVGATAVVLGVVFNVYAVAIAAGFLSALGMLTLVWREIYEIAGR